MKLGLWLTAIPKDLLQSMIKEIFIRVDKVKLVEYRFSLNSIGDYLSIKENHFKILLPERVEELQLRLSSKHRYNIKREKKNIEEEIGPIAFLEYNGGGNIPNEIIDLYYKYKFDTYHYVTELKPKEFIHKSGITDVYVMTAGGQFLSLILSGEACSVTLLVNLTYNPSFFKYSPGQVLYYHYLERLIEKGRKTLFLGGGPKEYKRRYGSIEDVTYKGLVFKNKFWWFIYRVQQKIMRLKKSR